MYKLPKILKAVSLPKKNQTDRFNLASEIVAENFYKIIDPANCSIWGYISIDNTQRGTELGGIRRVQNLSLNEIVRLARVMTLKNSAACLPYGGAKSGIILKSSDRVENSTYREEVF